MSATVVRCAADLAAAGCPPSLAEQAWSKILHEQFDAGNYVVFGQRSEDTDSDSDSGTSSIEEGEESEKKEDGSAEAAAAREAISSRAVEVVLDDSSGHDEKGVRGGEVSGPSMYSLHAVKDMLPAGEVFLIDHMWITTFPQSRAQLRQYPELLNRLGSALGITEEAVAEELAAGAPVGPSSGGALKDRHIDRVWHAAWPHLVCTAAEADAYTCWSCLDEVGLSLTHCNTPNMVVLPVTAVTPAPSGQGLVSQQLSVAWPVRAVSEGEMLTRDYLQGRHYATVADDGADSKAESGAIEVEPRSKEALQRDLTASLLSIGLMRTEHLSSGNAQSKMSDDESPVERVLNQSYKALQSSFLTPSVEPTMGTMGSKPQSYTIAASDHFDLRDFSNTSKSFEDSKKSVSGPLKPTVLPQWSAALNRLDEIRENGLPLKIYMDKKVYLWGQLAEPLPCDASAEELATDPSRACPIVLVDSPEEADVLYLIDHTYRNDSDQECEHYKTNKTLNQFWWEGSLVSKNMLARTLNRYFGVYIHGEAPGADVMQPSRLPVWFPASYDLDVPLEMYAYAKDFTSRTSDNYWILKRIVGRMSVDYPIGDSLQCMLRHCQGPLSVHPAAGVSRVASQYVLRPLTFRGRKFDIRFYLAVTSIYPLRMSRHEAFVIRLSNDVYSAENFEDFQKHFTLMSLLDDEEMKDIRQPGSRTNVVYPQFIEELNQELRAKGAMQTRLGASGEDSDETPSLVQWGTHLQPRMHHAVTSVFKAAQAAALVESPPQGEGIAMNAGWSLNQPNSCPAMAVYGVDILIDENLNPVILEIQWSPDAEKACLHTPSFWEDMMRALYLRGERNMISLCQEE